jgi:hypothetical protein
MCLLWTCCIPFLVKPASSGKMTWVLEKGSSPHCRRNHYKNSWHGRKSSGLKSLYPLQTVHGEPTTLSCPPHAWQLVFDDTWYGNSPLRVSVCAHPCTSSSSAVYHRRTGEQYRSAWCDDQWRDTCVSSEVYVQDSSPRTTLQLLHRYHGLRWELSAHWCILGMCSYPF